MRIVSTHCLEGKMKLNDSKAVLNTIEANLKRGYPSRNRDNLHMLFAPVHYLLNGKFEGKRVLDLGCGSVKSSDIKRYGPVFEPWLCRALHELGTQAIGIDLENLSGEEFEGHKLDLGKEDITKVIAQKSIDLACAFSLFDSPSNQYDKLFSRLLPQLDKVLKPEGIFLIGPNHAEYNFAEYDSASGRTQ